MIFENYFTSFHRKNWTIRGLKVTCYHVLLSMILKQLYFSLHELKIDVNLNIQILRGSVAQ